MTLSESQVPKPFRLGFLVVSSAEFAQALGSNPSLSASSPPRVVSYDEGRGGPMGGAMGEMGTRRQGARGGRSERGVRLLPMHGETEANLVYQARGRNRLREVRREKDG